MGEPGLDKDRFEQAINQNGIKMKNAHPLVQNISFVLLLMAVTLLFAFVIHGFLQPIFWAALMAVVFHALYKFFVRTIGAGPGQPAW